NRDDSPTGIILIKGGREQTKYRNVTLDVLAFDAIGNTVNQMSFMNAGGAWSPWEAYKRTKSWTLPSGDGIKKVWARFKDKNGRVTAVSDKIILDTRSPSASVKTPFISVRTARNSRFKVKWSGRDPRVSSGIASYQVQVKAPGTKWRTWRKTSRQASWFSGYQGRIYVFRVRARDRAGNVGRYSSAKKTVVPYDDNRRVRSREGFDHKVYARNSRHYKGTVRYSTVAGDKITYSFAGRAVYLISTKAADRSKAKIYLDGKYTRIINTYSENTKYRKIVFQKRWKKNNKHTITIENIGNRDRLDIDGIAVVK
ncbi:MAG: hypothetical protein KAX16_06755, partial [Actinomycetia bacterium]|nr:hypothetical protein [Actinomycetes bacterium]